MEGLGWRELVALVRRRLPAHVEVCLPAWLLPSPETAGFRRSVGLSRGRHYRLPLRDGSGVHVRRVGGRYCIHWDRRDPHVDPLGHLVADAPLVLALTGLAAALALLAL